MPPFRPIVRNMRQLWFAASKMFQHFCPSSIGRAGPKAILLSIAPSSRKTLYTLRSNKNSFFVLPVRITRVLPQLVACFDDTNVDQPSLWYAASAVALGGCAQTIASALAVMNVTR